MKTILEALGKWRLPDTVRSVAVELDDRSDEYVVTVKLRKPDGRDAVGTWRVGSRAAMAIDPYAIVNRLIAAANSAWNAPEPAADPVPSPSTTSPTLP